MSNNSKKNGIGFLFSVLLHFLLLLILILHFLFSQTKVEPPKPYLYSPAYLYQPKKNLLTHQLKSEKTKEEIIEKNKTQNKITIKKNISPKKSLLTATREFLQENRRQTLTTSAKYEEPVYMIGDQNNSPDPLIRLLAYVLSAHFSYPEIARKFGITGRTIVGMTLYPDGKLHNVQILESSGNIDLDHAALYAVNMAATIKKADRYISQPKRFIIGFVFRTYPNY